MLAGITEGDPSYMIGCENSLYLDINIMVMAALDKLRRNSQRIQSITIIPKKEKEKQNTAIA